MRYVDIDELDFSPEWELRAQKALDELRKEIENAELAAQLLGEDVALARKKAIQDGLNKTSRQKIWKDKDLSDNLGKLTEYKCWYSESKNPGSDKDVDHFRPKGSVAEDPTHEGYWWLAFDWKNYRYSCQWCNQRRVDAIHSTDGGKWDHFPLGLGSFRAKNENDDLDEENDFDLLDPTHPREWKLLTFRPDGHPIPAKPEGTREYDRAKASIFFYHLDRYEFVRDRKELVKRIRRIVEYMEMLRLRFSDPKMRRLYIEQEKELLRLINEKAEYSAAALAYVKAEGSKNDRQWLKEVLDLHN
jgi:hypothetical protein